MGKQDGIKSLEFKFFDDGDVVVDVNGRCAGVVTRGESGSHFEFLAFNQGLPDGGDGPRHEARRAAEARPVHACNQRRVQVKEKIMGKVAVVTDARGVVMGSGSDFDPTYAGFMDVDNAQAHRAKADAWHSAMENVCISEVAEIIRGERSPRRARGPDQARDGSARRATSRSIRSRSA